MRRPQRAAPPEHIREARWAALPTNTRSVQRQQPPGTPNRRYQGYQILEMQRYLILELRGHPILGIREHLIGEHGASINNNITDGTQKRSYLELQSIPEDENS